MNIEIEVKTNALLGEGPFWSSADQKLYWLDIEGKNFHAFDPVTKENRIFDTDISIASAACAEDGKFLTAGMNGFYAYMPFNELENPDSRYENPEKNHDINLELIATAPDVPEGSRFNDGKCDPAGRFWAGTVGPEKTGALYMLDTNNKVTCVLKGITVSNGLTWDITKNIFYYIDTPTREVTAYTYDNESGEIKNGKTVITVPEKMGLPDGMTIDEDGMLWICLWGGKALTRWNPQTGSLLEKINVPAVNVTSCAFGGKDLDILYITSARTGVNEYELKEYPLKNRNLLFTSMLEIMQKSLMESTKMQES